MKSKTIAFDFDGVVHRYRRGWSDGSIYDSMNAEVLALINTLLDARHRVYVFSTREPQQIVEALNAEPALAYSVREIREDERFWNERETLGVTQRKLACDVLIDDRCICFDPLRVPSAEEVLAFEPRRS